MHKVCAQALQRKIEHFSEFSDYERAVMIRVLHLSVERPERHEYPEGHGPTSSEYAKKAWSILDKLPVDALTTSDRFILGEQIARALEGVHECRHPLKPARNRRVT